MFGSNDNLSKMFLNSSYNIRDFSKYYDQICLGTFPFLLKLYLGKYVLAQEISFGIGYFVAN